MPLYEYKCGVCKIRWETVKTVKERHNSKCRCGRRGILIMSKPAKPVVYSYYSENLGARVTGPKQKREMVERRGLVERG